MPRFVLVCFFCLFFLHITHFISSVEQVMQRLPARVSFCLLTKQLQKFPMNSDKTVEQSDSNQGLQGQSNDLLIKLYNLEAMILTLVGCIVWSYHKKIHNIPQPFFQVDPKLGSTFNVLST